MSLILEALKKSEAKRRLGEAPNLGTPFTAPRRRSGALPLLFIAIVAAGVFGWWYLRKPAPALVRTAVVDAGAQNTARPSTTAAATAPKAVTPAAAPAATARAQASAATPAAADNATNAPVKVDDASKWVPMGPGNSRNRGAMQAARKLPPNMHRLAPAAAKAPAGTAEPQVATATATPTPVTAKPTAGAAAPQVATAAATPTPVTAKPTAGAATPQVATTAATQTPVTAKPAEMHAVAQPAGATAAAKAAKTPGLPDVAPATAKPAAQAEPAQTSATPAALKSDVPFYYELPFALRKSLPPLRLSMHVFAGDPRQRFVILNDSRLAEGEKTSDDVTLREVRKDGAVLEFQGQRFFFPRDM